MTAALALGACGRKGPLDPPPTASLPTPPAYTSRPSLGEDSLVPSVGERPRPQAQAAPQSAAAPPPPPKTFFLDFLIGR